MLWGQKKVKEFKRWHLIVLAVVVLAALAFKLYSVWHISEARVTIAGVELRVRVADTPNLRFRGWSNYQDMGGFEGMLFVFPERGQHTMVMREMLFPLDIVWVDGKSVVDIAPNLQPDPAKIEAELTPYFSRAPSTWVLELPAGFAESHHLKVGDKPEINGLHIN